MPGELVAPVALIYSFLLVLARVAGTMIFVPLPGIKSAPEPVRIVLILAITMSLYPVWPTLSADPTVMQFVGWLIVDAGFGLCIGLLVGFLADAALMFGQMCGLQAGYSFASVIDPSTEADSPVISALAQAVSGLLFVTLGLHRYVIRIFAESLQAQPPGQMILQARWGDVVIHAAGTLFSVGLRLALPVIVLLVMIDLTLALLSRINAHLQLLQLAMPLKMLGALATISILLTLFPTIYSDYATRLFKMAAGIAH